MGALASGDGRGIHPIKMPSQLGEGMPPAEAGDVLQNGLVYFL